MLGVIFSFPLNSIHTDGCKWEYSLAILLHTYILLIKMPKNARFYFQRNDVFRAKINSHVVMKVSIFTSKVM